MAPSNPVGELIVEQMIEAQRKALRKLSKADLRELWDNLGEDSFSSGFDCADIHAIMNEKGDGDYCAV